MVRRTTSPGPPGPPRQQAGLAGHSRDAPWWSGPGPPAQVRHPPEASR